MANALYPKGKEAILSGTISFTANDIRAMLIDTADISYDSTDQYVSDLTAAGIVARMSSGLTSKTVTSGTFDAADATISAVTGDSVEAIIIYKYNAADSAAELIAWIDGISVTPDGSDIVITWAANGIFTI